MSNTNNSNLSKTLNEIFIGLLGILAGTFAATTISSVLSSTPTLDLDEINNVIRNYLATNPLPTIQTTGQTGQTGVSGQTGATGQTGTTGQTFSIVNISGSVTSGTTGPLSIDSTTNTITFDQNYLGPEMGTLIDKTNIIIGKSNTPKGLFAFRSESIGIGTDAGGNFALGSNSIAIGFKAGAQQNASCIAIGDNAGKGQNSSSCISIGTNSGTLQQDNSIAIGNLSGDVSQGINSVAIGNATGNGQGANCIAIGNAAGNVSQSDGSICLGKDININDILENASKNRIALGLNTRTKDNNENSSTITNVGGAVNTDSFVVTSVAGNTPTINTAINDGSGADSLANQYLSDDKNVGFLNILVKKGSKNYTGFLPLLNLREV